MRIWIHAGLAGLLCVLFVGTTNLAGLDADTAALVSNLGQLSAVTLSSALCWACLLYTSDAADE